MFSMVFCNGGSIAIGPDMEMSPFWINFLWAREEVILVSSHYSNSDLLFSLFLPFGYGMFNVQQHNQMIAFVWDVLAGMIVVVLSLWKPGQVLTGTYAWRRSPKHDSKRKHDCSSGITLISLENRTTFVNIRLKRTVSEHWQFAFGLHLCGHFLRVIFTWPSFLLGSRCIYF